MNLGALLPRLPAPSADDAAAPAKTPAGVWVAALLLALLCGAAAAVPKFGLVMLGALGMVAAVVAILTRPINGFLLALCIFPFYTFARGLMLVYKIPAPLKVLGLWPELILFLMTAGILIERIRTKRPLRPLTWHDLPHAVLVLSVAYGTGLAIAQKQYGAVIYGFHESVTPFLFYAVARWMRPHPSDLGRATRVFLLAYALFALGSVYQYIFRPMVTIQIAMEMREGFWTHWDPYVFWRWYPRMQSLLFAEQLFGTISALVSIYCLILHGESGAWGPLGRRPRWVLPLFLLSTGCMLFSMSRGAYVCYVVALFVLLWHRGAHRRSIVKLGLVAAVLITGILIIFSEVDAVQQLVKRASALADSGNRNAYDRVDQWKWAIEDFPLFPSGRGTGVAGRAALFHGLATGRVIPDGGYWKTMAEVGLPGLLLFFLGAAGMAHVLVRSLPAFRGQDRVMCLTMIGFFGGLLVQNIAGNLFDIYYIPSVMWFFIGMLMARRDAGLGGAAAPPAPALPPPGTAGYLPPVTAGDSR